MSARIELKTGLAESRIETKLPINEYGLLHACLTDVRDSDVGAMMLEMQVGLRCAAGAYDQAEGEAGDQAFIVGCIRMRSGRVSCPVRASLVRRWTTLRIRPTRWLTDAIE